MVVKMMRWRPWPPLVVKKYEVRVVVKRLEGFSNLAREGAEKDRAGGGGGGGLTVEIRWKGPKLALSSLRRNVKRDFTKEVVEKGGVFEWEEEFQSVCNLSAYKDNNVFHHWEIGFSLLNGCKQGPKNKVASIGAATLNLAQFASEIEQKEFELSIPLSISGSTAEPCPMLVITLSLLELRTAQEPAESVPVPLPSPAGETPPSDKDELSALKAGLRKVKILTEYVSNRRLKKACREEDGSEGQCSARSDDGDCTYPFDSDSFDELDEGETAGIKEDSSVRKSFSYGTLAYANYAGGSFFSSASVNGEDEDWMYYGNRKSDVGCSFNEDSSISATEQPPLQYPKRSILPWRKRKLSFRSPKAKGEPLLKKAYAEDGGDDIDFDRRQLSSDESLSIGWHKSDEDSTANRLSISEFGDDSFAVGSWEHKEIISRDGQMKLNAQVFFASIDQRSERAAGESACTALVAVIADWLHKNNDDIPIKSQFDCLIREGSLEWRNLCDNEMYRERFPDKHFDLETILQAKIRPLSVHPGKSFIGFFHPDGMDEKGRFDFLHGAMSFDGIWDEISRARSPGHRNGEPEIYIVSWNDHFFILKVELDAYYIIDTLGERLYEGCNHAYILKFDRNTKICKLPVAAHSWEGKSPGDNQTAAVSSQALEARADSTDGEEEVVCQGKESCKEYMKSFLAAIPIRELLVDLKKGLMASTPLHHRLQIEFHYTQFLSASVPEVSTSLAKSSEVAITVDNA
ncbi:hypothetical protein Nepgr_011518 [Nepenthes gracilis]|uniref:C2 NT-type domain-containing protein n=1 Tax=Nepenthes gracilis TaxID=150966 RepID=A0AAD3SFL1_NEPGR|nr:hypothetical protein Nepgr_011518 [Nepenthes gracilis]